MQSRSLLFTCPGFPSLTCAGRALATVLALASAAEAGNVLRVGTGQPHATIQDAINAAVDGDLILVDPGSYPPFQIGTPGMGPQVISIFPSSGNYTVTQTHGMPEILVENVGIGNVVTISGALISHDDLTAPAVVARNCNGAVRMSRLVITQATDLVDATISAVVEVANVNTFWLADSSVKSASPRIGNTVNPLVAGGLVNDGISALQATDSEGSISNCVLVGYDNSDAGGHFGYAGDGARLIGESSFWLLRTSLGGPATFRGGNGIWGGHAVHQVRDPVDLLRNTMCTSLIQMVTLANGQQINPPLGAPGGLYASNNANNCSGAACLLVPYCATLGQQNEARFTNSLVPIGGSLDVKILTRQNRQYSLVISHTTRHQLAPPMLGREMLRYNFPLIVANGTTTADTPVVLSFPVPIDLSLIGMQLTAQALTGKIGQPFDAYSLPSLAVIGP